MATIIVHKRDSYQKQKRETLTKKQEAELREQVWIEQSGLCAVCEQPTRLKGDTVFNTFHLAHIKSKGSGGSDYRYNRVGKCYQCHINKEHGPQWTNETKEV